MFEYLMPALFLPYERGSLLSESARFCVYAQRRQVFAGKPWGISESAFYSLDAALNYRYKASGCAALALRRGQEADMVVAPYASFLALAVNAPAAVKNLRKLERFGARGRFGFYEALDFTPARCRRDEGELVACCMAHHVGMSVLGAANALCERSIARRFLSDPAMGACRLLRCHPWYVNHFAAICNSMSRGYIMEPVFVDALGCLISIHQPRFTEMVTALTTHQVNLLQATLCGITRFSAADVIRSYGLNSSANRHRACDTG